MISSKSRKRRKRNDPRNDSGWPVILSFAAFALVFVVYLALLFTGTVDFLFEHGLVAMLAGGFAVTGAGIAPLAWADYRGTTCSDTPMWIGLFTGLALWCIGPVLPILGGVEWTDWTGGGTYRMPLWGVAAVTWGAMVTVVWRTIRHLRSGDS